VAGRSTRSLEVAVIQDAPTERMQSRRGWLLTIGGVLCVLAEARWVFDILNNMTQGNSLGTFTSLLGFRVTYIEAFMFLVASTAAVVLGVVLNLAEWRDIRALRRKYHK
jgi:hypothetical protein